MIPRLRFANLPTPVETMSRLSAALNAPRLLIKRDDLTGLALGGNKTRKLEFLIAEAQAGGANTLITAGAVQSNHCRQTAAAAARFGMRCVLVLAGDPPVQPSGNYLLDKLLGAEAIFTTREQRDAKLKRVFDELWTAGQRPYLVPYGGSNATGALAYAFAVQELLEQGHHPDWIIFPSSSGGTQAGLVLGARRFGYQGKILGISVDEPVDVLQARVAALATDASDKLGDRMVFKPEDVLVNADYVGGGYGVMSELEKEAIRLFAANEGLLLDPVYTGRAAGGMIDLIRRGFFASGETILFWHTGGTPALFAGQYESCLL
jgi:D-cysteine desulfhydrase family pyridoxal phosphate-dependent enzyme